MFEEVNILNKVILGVGLFSMGFVSGSIITLLIIFDGISISIGKKGKQSLEVLVGEGEEGHTYHQEGTDPPEKSLFAVIKDIRAPEGY